MTDAPSQVNVSCSASGEPFTGALVEIRLPMWSKNPYMLVFGPSDADGRIRISGDELTARARAEVDAFPMDYATFPGEWTGSLGVEVLDLNGVHRLREAMKVWGGQFYPADFAHTLESYEHRLRALEGRSLRAEVAYSE